MLVLFCIIIFILLCSICICDVSILISIYLYNNLQVSILELKVINRFDNDLIA